MRQVQPLFDELCDPFSSMTTLDGLPVSFLRNLLAFWSASEFFFFTDRLEPPGLSNENRGRGLCRLAGSVPRMAFAFDFLFYLIFSLDISVVHTASLSITRC